MKKAKLLLLEDDINLSETVEEYLVEQGYEVVCAYDGDTAEEKLFEATFDLLLLDVNVPGVNGFELLKSARSQDVTVPAIFITSRNSIEDVETGFDSGADDYLRKPYELRELLLRIQTILKRRFFHHPNETLRIADGVTYDVAASTLNIGSVPTRLHDKEARLLKLFLQRRGEVIAHEVIMDHLWDFEETPSDTALRTYIKHLRQLLGKERIVSHKRLGYQFS
jgi:DNA-binding response OmpR family regulator